MAGVAVKKKKTAKAPSIKNAVGQEMYSAWMEMLKTLVPHGRTHRLSVVVAGMIQYASLKGKDAGLSDALEAWISSGDFENVGEKILPIIEQLFQDAKVKHRRTNARGEKYSIAEASLQEFFSWDLMPWE